MSNVFHVGDLDAACRRYFKARFANESEVTPELRDSIVQLIRAVAQLSDELKHAQGKGRADVSTLN